MRASVFKWKRLVGILTTRAVSIESAECKDFLDFQADIRCKLGDVPPKRASGCFARCSCDVVVGEFKLG